MAIAIPTSALRQNRTRTTFDTNGRGKTFVWKDHSFSVLETAAKSFAKGDVVETGWVLESCYVEEVPGGGGLLTVQCVPDDRTGEGQTSQKALKAVWTCKSVRNDVSILGYCNAGTDTDPSRVKLELWMKETDAAVANAFRFHKNETETDSLGGLDQEIAKKIQKGVESVMRFYPVLTCSSTWATIPKTFFSKLSYIDTPGAPSADEVQAPSNLSAIISDHQWVKCQDDVSETGDGKFRRDESWMGIKKSDSPNSSPWDPDLYGDNRWTMPYNGSGEG